jgi:hypothetical protein
MIYFYYKLKMLRLSLFKFKSILILSILTLLILGYSIGNIRTHNIYKNQKTKKIEEIIYITEPFQEFSSKNLEDYINELNIRFPHIVYSQAIQETGYFSSTIFKENNNLFGMKVARNRPTTALGTRRGHAYYRNWKESVLDYALWQSSYTRHFTTEEEYVEFIDRIYAEDKKYIQWLSYIVNKDNLVLIFQN